MILSLAIATLLTSAPASPVVARVDAVEITRSEILETLGQLRARDPGTKLQDAVDTLVLDALFAAEARRSGLADQPRVKEALERERRRVAAAELVEREVAGVPPPSDEELRRRYHSTADSVRLRVLVFGSADAAQIALGLVRRTGNFDDAARAPVPGFEMPGTGGGPKIRAQLPAALVETAFSAPIGIVVGPVQLDTGWALVKVLERRLGDEATYAAQREALLRAGKEQLVGAMKSHVRAKLRALARVTRDDAFLAALGRRPNATPAELEHVVATVNGKPVRYRDIEPSLRALSEASGHAAGPEVRTEVLDREIDERLFQDAAAERGLVSDPAVAAKLPSAERRVLATAYVEKLGASAPAPSDEEIRAFYRKNVAPTGESLESVRGQIASQLAEVKRLEQLQGRAAELKRRSKVAIDPDALAAMAR
ncbi:MAG TPA: peptidyl-prolyl cis-trans isomerase [Anaeromyxobacter sp.]